MSREFLYLVQESSYGTAKANPALGTDAFYVRMDGTNGFTVDDNPITWEIMYGGGLAIPALAGSDHSEVVGTLQTKLYAGAYSKFLLDWCATEINAGRTAPWVTTDAAGVMPVGDLASVSCYHAFQRNDGTFKRVRYAGCKAGRWRVECSRDNPVATMSIDIIAQKAVGNAQDGSSDPDATEFPFPTESQYPTTPYVFSHTAGNLKIGSVRTQYRSVTVEGTNTLDRQYFEGRFASLMRYLGRRVNLTAELYLKASPDDKATHRAVTAQDTEISFSNGVNTLKIDFHGNAHINTIQRNLPLDSTYTRTLTMASKRDASLSTDLTITAT